MSKEWNGTYHVAPGMTSKVGKCFAQTLNGCPYDKVAGHHKDHAVQVGAAEKMNEAQSHLIETHKANGSQKPVPDVKTLRDARFILASKPVAAKVNKAVAAKKAAPKVASTRLAKKPGKYLEEKFRQESARAQDMDKETKEEMKKVFMVKHFMPDIHAKR